MFFIKKLHGDDLVIVKVETLPSSNVRIEWKSEETDSDAYFSVIGKDKGGKLKELVGGEA